MYNCVSKILLFGWLPNTKKDKNVAFLKKNNGEHFNVVTVQNLCEWKITDFDRIEYGGVSEMIIFHEL